MSYTIELVCNNHTITEQAPIAINNNKKKVAIIVHLFYPDIWQEIQSYINEIKVDYDLFITIPPHIEKNDILPLFTQNSNIYIYQTPNQGRDVLPFLEVLNIIGTDSYQYICKIHSKKTAESTLGTVWRKLLYFDLIGSNKTVSSILSLFQNDNNIGMITGKNAILDSQKYAYGNNNNITNLAEKAGIIYDEYYYFAAGTMFWTRSEILEPILKLFRKNTLYFESESGQAENTLAHAIERFFGILCQANKQKIVQSPAPYSYLDDETLNEVASLVLSQQYAGIDVFSAQKKMIDDLHATIKFKESEVEKLKEIAESMRIKNRIKNLYPEKIYPLIKKSAKVPNKLVSIAKILKNNPTLVKKVLYYTKRGEIRYLIHKIREKSGNNIAQSELLTEVKITDYFLPFEKEKYKLDNITIDIIIPVYNGFEFLEALFDSVEKNTTTPYRLIVINDNSSDERVKPYLLKRLEKHPTAIFIDHIQNKGFLLSVNEAYEKVENHFVLLNTDTEVPSCWLARLMYPILHMKNIASTTPFTNSGEIASFPNFVADNLIFDSMSVEDLDESFKQVNPTSFYAEVPTGVGFCMGVNFDLAQKIGMFAEDTFGKGYGEENDWCQHAIKEGYKNLIVPNLFVYHKHGGSFSAEEKQKLLDKNILTLNQRHPNYGKDVTEYIQANPHETLRQLLVLRASNSTHPMYVIFDHALGGGANIYTQERIETYIIEEKNVLLVQYDYYSHCYILTHRYKDNNFVFKITTLEALQTFLDTLDIAELFINNLVSYKEPKAIIEYIIELQQKTEASLTLPIHDFYALCPSYNLLNAEGKYCNVPSIQECKTCMSRNMQEWRNFYDNEVDIVAWREQWLKLLTHASTILCFSESSKRILFQAYPTLKDDLPIELIPHSIPVLPAVKVDTSSDTTTTVGILGGISYVKGAKIIKQMIQIIERDGLDINIVIIGEITEPIKSAHFKTTGKYVREKLPEIIQEEQIDTFLIPSIWPETFSYTTQEIMMMELPLMVFDLGAPAERVKQYDKGTIINEISAQAVLSHVETINN